MLVRACVRMNCYPVLTRAGKMYNLKRGYLGNGTKHSDCMATI